MEDTDGLRISSVFEQKETKRNFEFRISNFGFFAKVSVHLRETSG